MTPFNIQHVAKGLYIGSNCCCLLTHKFRTFLTTIQLCTGCPMASPNIIVYMSAIRITRMETRISMVYGNVSYPRTRIILSMGKPGIWDPRAIGAMRVFSTSGRNCQRPI